MTKIKNTKKGMAKKTLSMSLVVAMLATSNVPVWAAEFSDGSDVSVETEAPVADETEAFSDEAATTAPVVDNTTDVDNATAATELTLGLTNWKDHLTVTGDIKDGDKALTNFHYKVKIGGYEVSDIGTGEVHAGGTYEGDVTVASGSTVSSALQSALGNAHFKAVDAGKIVTIEITGTGANAGFVTTIAGVEIKSFDVSNVTMNLGGESLSYTGKQAAFTDEQIKKFTFSGSNFAANELKFDDFEYTYTGEDLVNVTDKEVYVIATPKKAGYTGQIKTLVSIGKRVLKADDLEVTLKKDTISYAEVSGGNTLPSDVVEVKDTVTGQILPSATYTVASQQWLNAVDAKSALTITFNSTSLAEDKITDSNYSANSTVNKTTTDQIKVTANKIDDFNIVLDGIGQDQVSNQNTIKSAIHFYLGEKDVTSRVTSKITYTPEAYTTGATSLSVVLAGNSKEITGTKTVTLPVTLNVISSSTLHFTVSNANVDTNYGGNGNTAIASTTDLGAEVYNGEAITKVIKNVKSENTNLVENKDYKIVYKNDNVNTQDVSKRKVEVSIVGIGDWSGSVAIGKFAITPAIINPTDITVPEKVQYDGSLPTAADYLTGKVTVKATTTINGQTKKIDVPTDAYKLTCTITPTTLAPKTVITTKIEKTKLANKNFAIAHANTANEVVASKTTTITNKDIADTNVKVEVVGGPYTYTGKEIVPTIKVTVDGVELAKDIDYKIKSCTNNKNAGEATVTVEGDGDYTGTQTVKFTINKANLDDVKVEANTKDHKAAFTYNGKQVKPTSSDFKITLNGVELNASDFVITYPTTSKVNVNAGDATVTLVPVKTNANFTGDKKEVNFKILPKEVSTAELDGKFYAFDENGNKVDFSKTGYIFGYDGTEKKFKEVKFVPTANTLKLVEGKDYEIKYFNNITGPEAYVYINAIGNYTNKAEQTFPGSKQTYAVKSDAFTIAGVTVASRDVTLKDTEYAGGVAATPNLTIKVGEKTLVEGTDYEFVNLSNNTDVTPANKVLTANLKLKNGYAFNTSAWPTTGALAYDATTNTVKVTWKIVKKDLANTTVEISETNGKLTATVLNGKVIVPATEYDVKDNGDGTATVTAKADSKSYKGSQKVSVKKSENVGAPVISNVNVSGNTATVILSGETDGASGYDYVISTSKDPANKDARLDVVKNQVQTTANFKYVPQGTYYAYCHAWTRDENGKKVFGGWSNSYAFSVTAITPDTPEILSVKTKGSTITVTYKESANSTGYDVVLGKGSKKEHGETRPYQYGKYKKLNVKPGVCKAVFKNVPAGTYYAGVHSWNRTASENDNKVFSKWSNLKTAKVK